jgi:hypothetical protein
MCNAALLSSVSQNQPFGGELDVHIQASVLLVSAVFRACFLPVRHCRLLQNT